MRAVTGGHDADRGLAASPSAGERQTPPACDPTATDSCCRAKRRPVPHRPRRSRARRVRLRCCECGGGSWSRSLRLAGAAIGCGCGTEPPPISFCSDHDSRCLCAAVAPMRRPFRQRGLRRVPVSAVPLAVRPRASVRDGVGECARSILSADAGRMVTSKSLLREAWDGGASRPTPSGCARS